MTTSTTNNLLVATAQATDTTTGEQSTSRLRSHDGAFRWFTVSGDGSEEWDGFEYRSMSQANLDLVLNAYAAAPNLDIRVALHTITTTDGDLVAVVIRPHRVDTRQCPTTADAEYCKTVTHAVFKLGDASYLYRGTQSQCEEFIQQRQTVEATRAIAAQLFGGNR
jgi:hypothetical protein